MLPNQLFQKVASSFKTIVDVDLSGQTSKNAQQYDVVNKEDFVAALVEKANDLKNETGLYAFAEDNSRLVPLSDSYTQPQVWELSRILVGFKNKYFIDSADFNRSK